jgi:hypothetical protein
MSDPHIPDPPADEPEMLVRTACRLHARSQIAHLDQPVPWLWHGYLARHFVTLLTGQWKVGKTTLLTALLARMGAGGTLAGRAVTPGRAVVLTEEGAALWAPRLARHAVGDWAAFAFRPFVRKPEQRQWQFLLDDLADLHARRPIDLVVIDPLVAALPGREESSGEAMAEALRPVRELAARGPAVLLLHHPRKGTAVGGQSARGTGVLPAFADVLVEMGWPDPPAAESRRRRLTAWARFADTPRRVLVELSADGREYAVLADDGADGTDDTDAAVATVVRSRPGATVREVGEHWPANVPPLGEQALSRRLNRLMMAGRMTRSGAGHKGSPYRYWVAELREEAAGSGNGGLAGVAEIGVNEAEDDVGRRHAEGGQFAGDLAVGPVLFEPYLAVSDADVQDDAADPPLAAPADADDEVLVAVGVEGAAGPDAGVGRPVVVEVGVAGQDLADGGAVAGQGIHRTTSSAGRSTTRSGTGRDASTA